MDVNSHLKRWGAAYFLLALFVASWAGQFIWMLIEAGNEARRTGNLAEIKEALGIPSRDSDDAQPLHELQHQRKG